MPEQPRFVLMTHFIAPYRVAVFERLNELVPGFEVWVSTPMESNREWTPPEGVSFPIRVMPGISIRRWWRDEPGFELHIPVGALWMLMRAKPTTVVSAEFGARTIAAAAYRLTHPSSRLAIWATLSERTERHRGGFRHLVRRGLMEVADVSLANGRSAQRYLRTIRADANIRILHQATPTLSGNRPEALTDSDVIRLLTVGQLIPRKGLAAALPALDAWSKKSAIPVQLELIGSGPAEPELQAIAATLDIPVVFRGSLPYDATLTQYAKHDAMFFPTSEDEWGLVVNEALQSGRPVLGSVHAQAVDELVADGTNGVVFDPEIPDDLESALDRLVVLLDQDRERLTQTCVSSVLHETTDAMAQGLADVATESLSTSLPRDRATEHEAL